MPKQTHIGSQVSFATAALLEPFVVIGVNGPTAPTSIGKDAIIRSHSVIYGAVTLGDNVSLGHGVLIREHTVIGNNVSIGSHSVIEHHVVLKDGVRIHSNSFIPEFSVIEEDAWIGPSVVITNARYPHAPSTKSSLLGVKIGKGAKIGAGSVLLPGVVIGENALVGAGAVVTKNVSPRTIVVGNPAVVINTIDHLVDQQGKPIYQEAEVS